MKHVTEQCGQMMPIIRPVFTTLLKDGKTFVSAEIPGMDVADRPCFYAGKGRLKVSYVRVGDADQPMTEYEIYSYEAFRRKYQDDIRPIEQAALRMLQTDLLEQYLAKLKEGRPHLSQLNTEEICELMGITRDGVPTVAAVQLFGLFPQAYFPQMCVTAVSVPGTEVGTLGPEGERFLDNRRIERTLSQMLEDTVSFVRRNIRIKTVIDPETGKRANREDYPPTAVREAILNALIHRDYSIHTEGMPVQTLLFEDRFEVRSPGGLYGRLRVDRLGKVQPDTRNPVLAVAMEVLGETENRYTGIPTMRRELEKARMAEPEFRNDHGTFIVCFQKSAKASYPEPVTVPGGDTPEERLLQFCAVPRTRQEIAKLLGIKSVPYAVTTCVTPLVEKGLLSLSLPAKPRSPKQRYRTVQQK